MERASGIRTDSNKVDAPFDLLSSVFALFSSLSREFLHLTLALWLYGSVVLMRWAAVIFRLLLENFRVIDVVGEPWIRSCKWCWDETKKGFTCHSGGRGDRDGPCRVIEARYDPIDGGMYRWGKGEAPFPMLYKQRGILVLQNMRGCTNGGQ